VRLWLATVWAALFLTACDAKVAEEKPAPQPVFPDEGSDPPTVAKDGPDWKYSPWARDLPVATSAHWGILPHVTNYGTLGVGIIRRSGGNAIQVLCNGNRNTLSVFVWPRELSELADAPKHLALGFDGGALTTQDWLVTPAGFGLWDYDDGFNDVIHGLSQHGRVTVSVRGSGPEAEQDMFSLAGAKAAIDLVDRACR
jgi:hypothetical protein